MSSAAAAHPQPSTDPWVAAARSAIVDIAQQALGLPCEIVSDSAGMTSAAGALVPIVSAMEPVQIGLFSSEEGCSAIARALLGSGPDEAMSRPDMIDAVSEVVNMLAGNVKARVSRYASHAALGLPTFVHGPVEAPSQQVVDSLTIKIGPTTAQVVIVRTSR
ncbi:MAG: chemotaxis protein CheX [Deltaproteobacteria bacterium]|nr:chemotaxis protein CheX [Deltaproteobacteria bacterium]